MVRVCCRLVAVTLMVTLTCGATIGRVTAQAPDTALVASVPVPNAPLDLRTARIPLGDFLDSLTSRATLEPATRGKLVAGNDATIERISVYARKMPLPEVLQNVATLYGWEWSSRKGSVSGNTALVLGPSIKRKRWELQHGNAMVDNAFLPVLEKVRQERETWLTREREAKAAFLTAKDPKQREAREREYIQVKADTAAVRFCSLLTRTQKQQLLEQEQVYLPWSQLTTLQRDLAIARAMPSQFYKGGFGYAGKEEDEKPTPVGA